jgi:hypothetical protein
LAERCLSWCASTHVGCLPTGGQALKATNRMNADGRLRAAAP